MLRWLTGLLAAFFGFTSTLTTTFEADETDPEAPPPVPGDIWGWN